MSHNTRSFRICPRSVLQNLLYIVATSCCNSLYIRSAIWLSGLRVRNWCAASWQNQQCGCAPSEDSDQSGHPPSLISAFAVHMKKARVLSYPLSAQRRLWSDWADAQADLSLRWAHTHFVGFVTRRLIILTSKVRLFNMFKGQTCVCIVFRDCTWPHVAVFDMWCEL